MKRIKNQYLDDFKNHICVVWDLKPYLVRISRFRAAGMPDEIVVEVDGGVFFYTTQMPRVWRGYKVTYKHMSHQSSN